MSTLSVGAATVPEAPPSWSNRIVNAATESPGRADGAESAPAAVVGSAPGASLAAGAAAVPAALDAEDTSQGFLHDGVAQNDMMR